MKLLGTGLSGMVGSFVTDKLKDEYEFENLSLETGVDITKPDVVNDYFSKSSASWVLHFAAVTDVDRAEQEKDLGEKSSAWIVNVGATETIVASCKKYNKKLLYISTDFVFHGGDHEYTEEDTPDPIGWYATTKYEGEKRVGELGENGLIMRIAFPYGALPGPKQDFVAKLRDRLKNKQPVTAPVDQMFVPTYLGDIAQGIQVLLRNNASGTYHVVGSTCLSSFEAAVSIAQTFGYDRSVIQRTTAATYYQGRALRAFQLRIGNAKIQKLGLKPLTFAEGLAKIKVGNL
jgi:dTDP-4-dehydrorhamnose reductase